MSDSGMREKKLKVIKLRRVWVVEVRINIKSKSLCWMKYILLGQWRYPEGVLKRHSINVGILKRHRAYILMTHYLR